MTLPLHASKVVAGALFAFCLASPLHAEMTLTSPDIAPDSTIGDAFVFNGFGCTGPNTSPALAWEGAPEGTNSYIVNVYDPDAPTGSGFWHWAVFDLPASVTELPQGAAIDLPEGAMQARNDYSANNWGGPCPPQGDTPHRYIFTVYAMPQEKLGIDETASGAVVGFFANTSALDSASFTATYGR